MTTKVTTLARFKRVDPEQVTALAADRRRKAQEAYDKREAKLAAEVRAALTTLILDDMPSEKDIGEMSGKLVADILARFINGEVLIKNARDAVAVAKLFYDIYRLEGGNATSITEHLSREETLAKVQELREKARAG